MTPANKKESIYGPRLSQLVNYLVALSLSIWMLGKDIPALKIGLFMGGILILYFLSPFLFLRKKIYLKHSLMFFTFIALHFLRINPTVNELLGLSFAFRLTSSFVIFLLIVNLNDDLLSYSKMVNVLLFATAVITFYLVYLHLIVYHSVYLSINLTSHDIWARGRANKNTLSFFLSLIFPFYYAKFAYKKTIVNFFMMSLMGFAVLYTLSRMALLSLGGSMIMFAFIAHNKKIFIKQLLLPAGLVIFLSLTFGIGINTFMALKSPTEAAEIERNGASFTGGEESHRFKLVKFALEGFSESPIIGKGTSTFRGQDATGGSMTHNDYAQILYELGLLGFIFFIGINLGSIKDLWRCRNKIPEEFYWLWDALIVSLTCITGQFLFMNGYETSPYWFILAGCQIMYKVTLFKKNSEQLTVTKHA